MISKSEISLIRSLAHKKYRDDLGLFVVEGEKMVKEALNSDFETVSVYNIDEIGKEVMSRITLLSSPSPSLAVVRKKERNSFNFSNFTPKGLSIALDSVRDPGNLGTIIRLADWFGIEYLFLSEDCVDIYNPKVAQSSMGAIFRKQPIYIDIKKVVSIYLDCKKNVYGTFLDGENIYSQNLEKEDGLIVMGSENNGISPAVAEKITKRLFIPPYPSDAKTSESLNVAIATAIVCSEFRRKG